MRVLVADDELITVKMLEGLLTRWGYRTTSAVNGTEAWRILQEQDAPSLAILDWTMPGLDGVEICRRLRRRPTATPTYLILLTGRSSTRDLVAGLEAGANDYISKPFDADELRARVQVGRTVTELQQKVAQRMREFQDYVEEAPLGILVVEHDGLISFANNRINQMFGYEPGELVGQPVENLMAPALQERHVELRKGYFRCPIARSMFGRELFGRRKDNSLIPVAIGLNPLHRQTPLRVVSTVMDLTEQRQAEEELERFFELSVDLFCIARVDGTLLRVNTNFSRLLGYSTNELLSRPFYDYIASEDLPAVRAEVQRLAEGGSVVDFRCRLRDRCGQVHWVEWSSRTVPECGTMYIVGRNITERLRMEGELLYREQRERAILDNTPAVIYVRGADGRYEFVNRRHAELFSGDQASAVGKLPQDFFPTEVADRLERQDRQILATGQTITTEEADWRDDGVHTYVSVKFPLLDVNGRACATAGISTEITEQIRHRVMEHELKLARSFQSKLYPRRAPAIRGIDVAGSAVPLTQMCGDYYDYIQLGPSRLLVPLADVSGHGVGPALQMTGVRSVVRTLARIGGELTSMMADLNRMLCEDLPEDSFISFFLADIDLINRQIRHLGAGHDAFLIRADGTSVGLESTQPPLGIDPAISFSDVTSTDLSEGDVLFLFTDGLFDARSVQDEAFGRRRSLDIVARHRGESAEKIIEELFQAVYDFTRGCVLQDDITAVVAKVVG